MRGLVALALAFALTACATNRSALAPPEPVAVQTVPVRACGPLPAQTLASRLGLGYQDADSHVLLADDTTRVRIWKDSNELSVGGQTVRLKDRTRRQGPSLIVPSSMVSYVETRVVEQRNAFARTAPRPRPRTAYVPKPLPRRASPAAPRTVHPALVEPVFAPPTADAGWEPRVNTRAWRWIVIHHSDDTSGNFAKYDRIHRESNGWDECGYHFVIGNGTMSGDGQVEIGSRWFKQKHGAHCKTSDNCFNDYGIGICLVGDFENGAGPTAAQMDALARLSNWLMIRFGIPLENVKGHADCKATACPGRNFPWGDLRRRLSQ